MTIDPHAVDLAALVCFALLIVFGLGIVIAAISRWRK